MSGPADLNTSSRIALPPCPQSYGCRTLYFTSRSDSTAKGSVFMFAALKKSQSPSQLQGITLISMASSLRRGAKLHSPRRMWSTPRATAEHTPLSSGGGGGSDKAFAHVRIAFAAQFRDVESNPPALLWIDGSLAGTIIAYANT